MKARALRACPALWQEAGPRTEKRARDGWNGRPARGCRRLAGSISRSEPARCIARRGCRCAADAPDAGRVGQRAGRPFHPERAVSAVARAGIRIPIPDSEVQDRF